MRSTNFTDGVESRGDASADKPSAVPTLGFVHLVRAGADPVDLQPQSVGRLDGLQVTADLEKSIFTLPQHHDVVLSVLMHMCRFNYGDALLATRVRLAHPEPQCTKIISDYFRTPIIYDAPASSLTLARRDVDLELPSGNRELALLHDEFLMKYLVEIKKGDIVQQIQSVIIENLPSGKVTDNLIAKELNLSERSLQRKLADMGTRYSAVLDQARFNVASRLLQDPGINVFDVSQRLGYGHPTHFSRAFRKIAGITPREYRAARAC